ncbi:hypothetical protein PR202_gb15914 [Eleusine coracana subsp. coracana]|uniref:Amino acid transporter transmembrane domain-containing protein n=1 Tax=Eleusine coracana subsp. coracana TaxID=191504 RepID=A0AAV5EZ55_ELECO|nr:hypothetical protein PR202_gb15914 [Eleusine coracana subsp. coracana]
MGQPWATNEIGLLGWWPTKRALFPPPQFYQGSIVSCSCHQNHYDTNRTEATLASLPPSLALPIPSSGSAPFKLPTAAPAAPPPPASPASVSPPVPIGAATTGHCTPEKMEMAGMPLVLAGEDGDGGLAAAAVVTQGRQAPSSASGANMANRKNAKKRYKNLEKFLCPPALVLAPIAEALEDALGLRLATASKGQPLLLRVLVRTAVVAATATVALAVPFFGDIVSLTGALLSCSTTMLLPCLCYLRVRAKVISRQWQCEKKMYWLETAVCTVIVVVGAAIVGLGTYSSVKEIVRKL